MNSLMNRPAASAFSSNHTARTAVCRQPMEMPRTPSEPRMGFEPWLGSPSRPGAGPFNPIPAFFGQLPATQTPGGFQGVIDNLISVIESVITKLLGLVGQTPSSTGAPQQGAAPTGGSEGSSGSSGSAGSSGSSNTSGTESPTTDKPGATPDNDHCSRPHRFPLSSLDGKTVADAKKIAKKHGFKVRVVREGQKIRTDFKDQRITIVIDKKNHVKDARYC